MKMKKMQLQRCLQRIQVHKGEIHMLSKKGSADTPRNGQSGTRYEQAVSNHMEMLEKGPVDFTGLVSIFSPS